MAKHWKWGFVILAAVWAALFGNMLGYAWNVTHREEPIPEVPMEQIQNTNISEVAQETMDRSGRWLCLGWIPGKESLEKARGPIWRWY